MAEPPASAPAARTGSHLSIGEVLALLLEEFPDVTISKIRFLESQGLIDPERTASGYRKFYDDDVELLRCILREQRENYLPLRVIKDRIDSGEIDPTGEHTMPEHVHRGIKNVGGPSTPAPPTPTDADAVRGAATLFQRTDGPPPVTDGTTDDATSADDVVVAPSTADGVSTSTSGSDNPQPSMFEPDEPPTIEPAVAEPPVGAVLPGLLLSADELCAMSGLTEVELTDLRTYGVVTTTSGREDGSFDEDAVEIATISKHFLESGIEPRHLRGWRVAADREAGLLEQMIQPLLRQRNPEARAQAVEQLNDLEATGSRLRHAMMRSSLREHGLR